MNSGVAGNILLPSFPRKRESTVPPDVRLLDYSLRLPFGSPYGRSTRFALLSRLRGNDGFIHTSLWKQRGAGTMMATVFLLLIVALLGGIGLRLASTDINDTAVQNDSVEALFLAESGLERAMQRLVTGTCAAVAEAGTRRTLGRGDFEIQSSTTVGSLCRVRVLGRVLLNGAMRAQRLVEGDLAVSRGGWAVGFNSTILNWNGSAWTTAGFTNSTPAGRDLYGVYCVSASDCWAVGESGTIVRWNSSTSTWTTAGFSNGAPAGENLLAVFCLSSTSCWASGTNGTLVRLSGTTWSTAGFTNGAPNNRDLNALYCLSSTECWAVGERDGGDGTIVLWNGTSWSTSGFTNNTPNAHLRGVACTSSGNCWAVGNTTSGTEDIIRLSGTSWTQPTSYAGVPNVSLRAIQCLNADDCWAVGNTSSSRGTIIRWNSNTWTNVGITNNSPNQTLYGLNCSAVGDCWAVGNNGASTRLSGTTWSTVVTPTTQSLRGVFFPTGSSGGSTGVQVWREIIL